MDPSEEQACPLDCQIMSRRRLTAAILQTTADELSEVGYQRLTVEGVARRARTSKPVIYRRWPHKAALVLAAIRRQRSLFDHELPNTETVRGDVLTVVERISEGMCEIAPETLTGLLAGFGENSPVDLRRSVQERGVHVMLEILRRGVQRGEVRGDCIAALPIELYHAFVIIQMSVTDETTQEILDTICWPLVCVGN